MNEIRSLKQEELFESLSLSEFAFQYELTPEEKAERIGGTDPNHVWGYFVEGQMAAKLTIMELETWLHGKSFAMGGIAAVATWPEYRRNGMVGQLLAHALKVMKEQGQTVSFLAPFKFEFYRKYGWETYIDYLKYEIAANQLPKFNAVEGSSIVRVERDWQQLNPIYERYAVRFNGMLKRDEKWWNQRIFKFKKGTTAIYRDAAGESAGYVFYQVKDKVATVHELVFLNEEARRGLWKFLADHDSMIEKVVLQAPVDDALPFLMHDPRFKQEKIPYFMARIVDVSSFLEQYPFAGSEDPVPLYLQVTDRHAEWNNGIYELRPGRNGAASKVRKLNDQEQAPAEMIVSCTIQTLTALLMGYQKASFLAIAERLSGQEEQLRRWQAIIPERTTYLADFF